MNIRSIVFAGSTSCLLLLVSGCSPPSGRISTPAKPKKQDKPKQDAVKVDWESHAPELKARIDKMAADGECKGLQEQFDIAERNNAAQRKRTGDGNDDLMGYIDQKMREAGCYK